MSGRRPQVGVFSVPSTGSSCAIGKMLCQQSMSHVRSGDVTQHHAHDHGNHDSYHQDWAVMARRIEVEGEVLLPILDDASAQIS